MPLTPDQVARALSDPEYRASLSDAERAELPDHPAGSQELSDEVLEAAAGGAEAATDLTDLTLCPTCDRSFGGSCEWFSFGCCDAVALA